MTTDPSILTVQERLAASRLALVRQFEGRGRRRARPEPAPEFADFDAEPVEMSDIARRFGWTSIGRSVIRRWWRRHPANAVGQVAAPLLERYAREEPVKLLAGAAATGALVVLVRPWRLLSITAVLAALLKTSDVADLVTTLMQNNAHPRKDPP